MALLLAGKFPSTASTDEGLTTYGRKPVALHEEGHLHYFTYRFLSRMLIERCGFSRVVKYGYAGGRMPLGGGVHSKLANVWPENIFGACVGSVCVAVVPIKLRHQSRIFLLGVPTKQPGVGPRFTNCNSGAGSAVMGYEIYGIMAF